MLPPILISPVRITSSFEPNIKTDLLEQREATSRSLDCHELVIFPMIICSLYLPPLAEEQMQAMFEMGDWEKADANNDTKLDFPEYKVFQKASE